MTLEHLSRRHSVRSYSPEPLSDAETAAVKAAVTAVNSHEAGLHFTLVTNSPDAFKGFGRSYGMFRGVRNYIALAVDSAAYDFMDEKAGYYAQMLVMRLVSMGLGTCFVGGTFSRRHLGVRLRAGWSVPAVISLGHPLENGDSPIAKITRKIAKRHSKSPEEFYSGKDPDVTAACGIFPNLMQGLEAASYAPSALNRQPVTFTVKRNSYRRRPDISETEITEHELPDIEILEAEAEMRRGVLSADCDTQISLDTESEYVIEASVKESGQLIDLGIAMWNFEQLFPGYWLWGNPATLLPCVSLP